MAAIRRRQEVDRQVPQVVDAPDRVEPQAGREAPGGVGRRLLGMQAALEGDERAAVRSMG